MTAAPGGPGAGTVAVSAALFCAAVLAWALAGRDGPGRTRLLLAAGADAVPARHRRDQLARLGGAFRAWLTGASGRRVTGGSADRLRHLAARAGQAWWCLPAGALLGVLGDSLIPLCAGLAAVPLVSRRVRAHRERRAAERTETAVIGLCASVAGELRSGRLPDGALITAGAGALGPEGAALLAAARFGGDVPMVLRRASRLPGAEGLRGVAACWQVSSDGGAGLADGLDRVAGALRAERDQREELRAQLAGPRSTAVVLALLPACGLLLGTAMGAAPFQVLLHSPVGLGCLAAGGALEWAGLVWVSRLVRGAEESS